MTSANGEFFGCTAQRHFEQLLEWAEQAFQSHNLRVLKRGKAIPKRHHWAPEQKLHRWHCVIGLNMVPWLAYPSICTVVVSRRPLLCIESAPDKAKKELDDRMASKAVPCAEVDAPDELQDADAPVTTCCPGGVQNTNDSSSSDDEDDDE